MGRSCGIQCVRGRRERRWAFIVVEAMRPKSRRGSCRKRNMLMGRASAMYDAMLDGLVLSRGWGGAMRR
jgi:hypothetical protein